MVTSSSSAVVSWNPLSVPRGISVKHYKLSYGLKGEREVNWHVSPPFDTRHTISGLHSDRLYILDVSAVIEERDGSLHSLSLVPPSSGRLEFYIPGKMW